MLNTRIQLKTDTAANWTTNNPVLKEGELAIVSDGGGQNKPLIKVGDGVSTYTNLSFASELPRVSSEDEGKILRVSSEGVWEAQELATISVENATIDGLTTTTYKETKR